MQRYAFLYILLGLVWLIAAMSFGIWLGATEHFAYAESHAHMALVGFASSVLFGLIHHAFPALSRSAMAMWQLVVYQIGAAILIAGKIVVDGGGAPTVVKVGSVVVLLGAVLMLVLFATKGRVVEGTAARAS